MGKGKGAKRKGNGKTCFIPRTSGMSWSQFSAQSNNMQAAKKISDEALKRKPNNK